MINLSDDKIIIQKLKSTDINVALVSWLNSKEVMKFSRQRFLTHSLSTSLEYFESFIDTENLYLKISDKVTKKMLGTMTVYFDENKNAADIGILIGEKNVWGMGYGTRCWELLIKYLFREKKVDAVTGGCDIGNIGMISVFKKIGMKEFKSEKLVDQFSEYQVVRYRIFRNNEACATV